MRPSFQVELKVRHGKKDKTPDIKNQSGNGHVAQDVDGSTPIESYTSIRASNSMIEAGATDRVKDKIPNDMHESSNDDSSRRHVLEKTNTWGWEILWRSYTYILIILVAVGFAFFLAQNHGNEELSQPFFTMDRWDQIQSATASIHVSMNHNKFSNFDEIWHSVQEVRNRQYRCRFLITGVNVELSTTVTGLVQQWVFKKNCTPALFVAMTSSGTHIKDARNCVESIISALTIAFNQTQIAEEKENIKYAAILKPHINHGHGSHLTKDQVEADELRQRETQNSLSVLSLVKSRLLNMTRDYEDEVEQLRRLDQNLMALDLVAGSSNPQDVTRVEHDSANCVNRDIAGVNDKFLSMAYTAIQVDERIHQFNIYYESLI